MLFNPVLQNILIAPIFTNRSINWVKPATIIDQASAKWESDLKMTNVEIIKILRMIDKKEGKKKLPLTFNTELNTDDNVTNIKKGKVMINSSFVNKNWLSFNKNPGANNDITCSLNKNIKKDISNVITKKKVKNYPYKILRHFWIYFFLINI